MKLTANPAWLSLPPNLGKGSGAKFLRIMKLTTIIILAACLHTSAKGVAQQTITFSGKEVSLESVFSAIKKQTNYRFFFNTDMLTNASKVTLDVKNAQIEQVMNMALKDQPLTFTIKGRTIFVMKKVEEKKTSLVGQQPPINVQGRVVNENGDPVEGVTANVKGTSLSVSTNNNGEFFIKGVDDNAILVFTSVNTETFEVKVGKKPFMNITLQTKVIAMQEVVINKGYYTESKRLSTGNVSSVKARDIEKQVVQNPILALVGRVPGLFIEQASGFANSGVKVRIQGLNSLSSGVDPLYVIDGVPYASQTLPTIQSASNILGTSGATPLPSGGGNPLSFINPNDIEGIEVLKDADATAIYGSRGANGVILISTKKGKAGKTKFSGSLRSGWGTVSKKVDLLNTQQYLEMRNEAISNDGLIPSANPTATAPFIYAPDLMIWDTERYTDWQKELIGGNANYNDAQISVSGGTSNTQFLFGGGYHKETTVFPGNFSDRKGSFQFSVHHTSSNQKLDMQVSGNYIVDNNQIPTTDLTQYAMLMAPNAPSIFDEHGMLNWASVPSGAGSVSTWTNPLSYLENRYTNKINNLIGNVTLNYKLPAGFAIKTNVGYTNMHSNEVATNSLLSQLPERRPTSTRGANFANGTISSWIIEPQASYQLSRRRIKIEALVGSTFQRSITSRQQFLATGQNSDLVLTDIKAASSISVQSTLDNMYKYNALFGRVNFNHSGKYILNITARRDGSSRFGSENLFNNFWGISEAWIFSKERFINENLRWLSFGKLRVSYGTSGNDQIGDYTFMNLYTPVSNIGVSYQGITSIAPDRLTNPYLQWEETRKLQFGLDLGVFNDRLLLTLNYYRNRSSNILTSNGLSVITGFSSVSENFDGVIQNTGWEFAINSYNIRRKDFSWSTSVNLTIPNNKLTSFPNLANTSAANAVVVGRSLFDLKAYHFLGVDPATGIYSISDRYGNPTFSPSFNDDRITFNNTSPKFYGGIENSFTYRGFALDFLFQFVKRNGNPYLLGNFPGSFNATSNNGNQPVYVLNRWRKPGDIARVQRFSASNPVGVLLGYINAFAYSDAVVGDASYMRLTNLSLSYRLSESWRKSLHLESARVFINGQNLLTISDFVGLDPSLGNSYVLPPLRIVTLGIQVAL